MALKVSMLTLEERKRTPSLEGAKNSSYPHDQFECLRGAFRDHSQHTNTHIEELFLIRHSKFLKQEKNRKKLTKLEKTNS